MSNINRQSSQYLLIVLACFGSAPKVDASGTLMASTMHLSRPKLNTCKLKFQGNYKDPLSYSATVVTNGDGTFKSPLYIRGFLDKEIVQVLTLSVDWPSCLDSCTHFLQVVQGAVNEMGYPTFMKRRFESIHRELGKLGLMRPNLRPLHCPTEYFDTDWGEVKQTPYVLKLVTGDDTLAYMALSSHECSVEMREKYFESILASADLLRELLSRRCPDNNNLTADDSDME